MTHHNVVDGPHSVPLDLLQAAPPEKIGYGEQAAAAFDAGWRAAMDHIYRAVALKPTEGVSLPSEEPEFDDPDDGPPTH